MKNNFFKKLLNGTGASIISLASNWLVLDSDDVAGLDESKKAEIATKLDIAEKLLSEVWSALRYTE